MSDSLTEALSIPPVVPNQIDGAAVAAASGETLSRHSPHDNRLLWKLARSGTDESAAAVAAARAAFPAWRKTPAPARGDILFRLAALLEQHLEPLTAVIAAEAGKSPAEARGEIEGAIACGRFFAGEGMRLYGRTTPSMVAAKRIAMVREPIGVAALIVGPNTPIANVAWKSFPALICGNTVVLKASEHAPATVWYFGELARLAGVPDGVFNTLQGLGPEVGEPLVSDERVEVISFTGSTAVGRHIGEIAAKRLARVSLELGGKNPFVVLEDADLPTAVDWASKSAFFSAGQRCASGSRLIVADRLYDAFRDALIESTRGLRLGPNDGDDLGPLICEAAMRRVLAALDGLDNTGAEVLVGGQRATDASLSDGWYVQPTVVEMHVEDHPLNEQELFAPVTQLFRARDDDDALRLANESPYGLTACVHTQNWDRAMRFADDLSAGVAVINGGTYGSEPHMPFGGRRQSGNGTREPGTEALDIYSELKCIYGWVGSS